MFERVLPWLERECVPMSVGHDAQKLILLAAARRRISPALETAPAGQVTLFSAGTVAPPRPECSEVSPPAADSEAE